MNKLMIFQKKINILKNNFKNKFYIIKNLLAKNKGILNNK